MLFFQNLLDKSINQIMTFKYKTISVIPITYIPKRSTAGCLISGGGCNETGLLCSIHHVMSLRQFFALEGFFFNNTNFVIYIFFFVTGVKLVMHIILYNVYTSKPLLCVHLCHKRMIVVHLAGKGHVKVSYRNKIRDDMCSIYD
jgi:hypothetical protein